MFIHKYIMLIVTCLHILEANSNRDFVTVTFFVLINFVFVYIKYFHKITSHGLVSWTVCQLQK
jgi:hypothetical protein